MRFGVSAVSTSVASPPGLAAEDEGGGSSADPLLVNSASRAANAASTIAASGARQLEAVVAAYGFGPFGMGTGRGN
jgi:hypothetical protein